MSDRDKCGNCKFFVHDVKNPNYGMCKKSPPTLMWVPGQTPEGGVVGQVIGSSYPPTQYAQWCGSWEKGALVKGAKVIPGGNISEFPGEGGI